MGQAPETVVRITKETPTGNTRGEATTPEVMPVLASTSAAGKLRRRIKKKGLTELTAARLTALGRDRTPLQNAYERTIRCATTQQVQDGKATSTYCKNRWCNVCNDIRTAKHTTQYADTLRRWEQPTFLTLTIPNVEGKALHGAVREMQKTIRRIADRTRKRDGLTFTALRKLEVSYNATKNTYHPHFHFIVNNARIARLFKTRWLEAYPSAYRVAQDIRPATDVRELLKYETKQITKTKRGVRPVPAWAQDTIYRALRRLRTLQPMGFKGAPQEITDEDGTIEVPTTEKPWTPRYFNWTGDTIQNYVERETGEPLLDYEPSAGHLALLDAIRTAPADPPQTDERQTPQPRHPEQVAPRPAAGAKRRICADAQILQQRLPWASAQGKHSKPQPPTTEATR